MRRVIIGLMVICTILQAVGCHKDDPAVDNKPESSAEIRVRVAEHSIDASGGEIKIAYALMNGGEETMTISKGDDTSWFECEVQEAHIVVDVEGNIEGKERVGKFVLSHPRAKDVTITITQRGYEGDIIKCWADKVNATDAYFCWESNVKSMYVVGMVRDVAYLKATGITSAEELFEHDMNLAHAYAGNNAFERLRSTGWMFKAAEEQYWFMLNPTGQYVIYGYGVEFSEDNEECYRITEIYYEIVTMPAITDNGAQLEAELRLDGAHLVIDTHTNGYTGVYNIIPFAEGDKDAPLYLPEGTEPDQLYYNEVARYFNVEWYNLLYLGVTSTYEEVMDYYITGDHHQEMVLWPETNYTIAIFAIDLENGRPAMTSTPMIYHITTGDAMRDFTIDFEVSNITAYGCDYTIVPSNNEDTYAFRHVKTSLIEGMTDDEIIQYLFDVEHVIPWYSGVKTYENSDLYLPDTEYSILAFGGERVLDNVLDCYVTTPLFRHDYRTLEATPAKNRITNIEIFGPYDYYAIKDRYPNFDMSHLAYAILYCWKITTENDNVADIKSTLLIAGSADHYGEDYTWTFTMGVGTSDLYSSSLDKKIEVSAILKDNDGNYSELFVSEPFVVENGTEYRDPQEFMEIVSRQY